MLNLLNIFYFKFLEVFGIFHIQGNLVSTGVFDWLVIIDLIISVVTIAILVYYSIKSLRLYLKSNGSTSELYIFVTSLLICIISFLRIWVSVTYYSYQFFSIINAICLVLVGYYFALSILLTPSIVELKKYTQLLRTILILMVIGVIVYLYSIIEYRSVPIIEPRSYKNILVGSIEPLLQTDCLSFKSFTPNIVLYLYRIIMVIAMMRFIRKAKLTKRFYFTYAVLIVVFTLSLYNSTQKIFYSNYADLRWGKILPSEYFSNGTPNFDMVIFKLLTYFNGFSESLKIPVTEFIGVHNVIYSYLFRVVVIIGFIVNSNYVFDNKSLIKLEEKQYKKLKKLRRI